MLEFTSDTPAASLNAPIHHSATRSKFIDDALSNTNKGMNNPCIMPFGIYILPN